MRMRTGRMFAALLGILAVAVFAPQLASADTSTGALSGTVTNSVTQDIAGIEVTITNVGTGNTYSATTGADGTYSVTGLPPGNYQVLFQPNNGQGQDYVYQYYPDKSDAAAAQTVAVIAGQTTPNVNAALATGATVGGTVTDAATGTPVSGVYVYVYDYGTYGPSHVSTYYTTTDSTGAWSLAGYPTGTYEVRFSPYSGNYASQYWNGANGQDPPTPLTLTAGSTTSNINAALAQGGQITGVVTNGMTGAPAANVFVSALDDSGNQFASATTDSSGFYTLSGLSPSASYRVEFAPPTGSSLAAEFYPSGASVATATAVPVTIGHTTQNINETLSQGASISGLVTEAASGYPIGNVNVTLLDSAGQQIYAYNGGSTEPDGRYDLTNLAPGSYRVEFPSEGDLGFQYYNHASTLSAATPVTLSAGQAVTNIDAALTQGGRLAGVVTDAMTGLGLADAYVAVVDPRGVYVAFAFTDPSGRYEISGVAPGTYYVYVYPDTRGVGATDQPEFYGGTFGLAGATPVRITAGATTAGINLALSPVPPTSSSVSGQSMGTAPVPPPHVPVAVVTHANPGHPVLFGGSLSGLAKGKPVLKFHLKSGSNGGHRLRSFKVKLPAGLAFVAAHLRDGVKVTGGGKVTEKLIGGQLLVTLRAPSRMVTVRIGAPAVRVSGQLAAKAAGRRAVTLRVTVTVTPVHAASHMLSFTVKNPS